MSEAASKPDWDRLFEIAAAQAGYFTTQQAAHAGYSTHLLFKHIHSGRVTRASRGIYRLVHYPAGEHDELVPTWLWSEQAGVFSHQTALSLHGLSDALPSQLHLTLPSDWKTRRFRVPPDVVLYHADILTEQRTWYGPVPTTNVQRTLNDCAREGLSPELLRQATQQALRRGLVTKTDVIAAVVALAPFGGLEP